MQTFRNISLEKMNTSLASTNNLNFLGCAAVGGSMRRMGRDIPSATQEENPCSMHTAGFTHTHLEDFSGSLQDVEIRSC